VLTNEDFGNVCSRNKDAEAFDSAGMQQPLKESSYIKRNILKLI
jgi:hypothetical protein